MLTMGATNEETFDAVKQMNPLKALGLDGIQAIFNNKSWDHYQCVIWFDLSLIMAIC